MSELPEENAVGQEETPADNSSEQVEPQVVSDQSQEVGGEQEGVGGEQVDSSSPADSSGDPPDSTSPEMEQSQEVGGEQEGVGGEQEGVGGEQAGQVAGEQAIDVGGEQDADLDVDGAAKKRIIKIDRTEAINKVKEAGELIKSAPPNLDMSKPTDSLKRAASSLKLKAWPKAKTYAEQAIDETLQIRKEYMDMAQEYSELESIIKDLKDQTVSIPIINKRNNEIQEKIKNGRIQDAVSETRSLKSDIEYIVPIYRDYIILDNRIRDVMGRAIQLEGIDVSVGNIIENFNQDQWEEAAQNIKAANELIDRCLDEDKEAAAEAHEMLTTVYEFLANAPGFLNLDEAKKEYNLSKDLFTAESYLASMNSALKVQNIVDNIRNRYNQVLDAISAAEDQIDEARMEGGYKLNFNAYEDLLKTAKQTLMENDFDLALIYTQDCLDQLTDEKRNFVEHMKTDNQNRLQTLGSELVRYDPYGIDVSKAKEFIVTIQGDLAECEKYNDFKMVGKDLDKLEEMLIKARWEYDLLQDIPKYLKFKLKEIKNQLGELDLPGSQEGALLNDLDACLDKYAMTHTEEEEAECKEMIDALIQKVRAIRESSAQMDKKRKEINETLNVAEDAVSKLAGEEFDVSALEDKLDALNGRIDTAKKLEELDDLEEEIGNWISEIDEIFEIGPKLYNIQQEAQRLMASLNKLYRRFIDEDLLFPVQKGKVEVLNKLAPEAATVEEYEEILKKGQPLHLELESIYEDAKKEKENQELAQKQLEDLKSEVAGLEGRADLTTIKQNLSLADVALASRQYTKVLEFIETSQQALNDIKDPALATVDIELETGGLVPNIWGQSKLTITNTSSVNLKKIQIDFEGPLEIRLIKPVEALGFAQEHTFEIGVMFKGAGKIPLDMTITAERELDGGSVEIQKDMWVNIAAGEGPAAPSTEEKPAGIEWDGEDKADEIIAKIEKLAKLKEKGIISEEEFQRKKGELLDQY